MGKIKSPSSSHSQPKLLSLRATKHENWSGDRIRMSILVEETVNLTTAISQNSYRQELRYSHNGYQKWICRHRWQHTSDSLK